MSKAYIGHVLFLVARLVPPGPFRHQAYGVAENKRSGDFRALCVVVGDACVSFDRS